MSKIMPIIAVPIMHLLSDMTKLCSIKNKTTIYRAPNKQPKSYVKPINSVRDESWKEFLKDMRLRDREIRNNS